MPKSGGQPGNNNAVKNKPFRDALHYCLANMDENGKVPRKGPLYKAVCNLLIMAGNTERPNLEAIKTLAERLDGKAIAYIDTPDDKPITLVKRVVVELPAQSPGNAPIDGEIVPEPEPQTLPNLQ